jgi:hypothetical protein
MNNGSNRLSSLSSLPTLAAAQRRRRELLASRAWQQTAQTLASHSEPLTGQECSLEEEPCLPQENQERQETYPGEDAEPSSGLLSSAPPPPTLADPALYGLAGLAVQRLAPHTEAHPAAILLQFLAAFGNLVGPAPHCLVGSARHGLNLFVVLVGESSKARKGTSWRQLASLFAQVDPGWAARRVTAARPTANSILHALRDQQPVTDRRLFLLSEEFASVLHALGRQTGQLSPLLRSAWDGGDLCAHNGHHPLQVTGSHIGIVGHVTPSELAHHLRGAQTHNGFANRCLWTSVHRSQFLPEGGSLPPQESSALADELRRTLDWVQGQTEILFRRTTGARELWNDCYSRLSQARQDLYGAATSRAEAQVLRLSAIYAALDRSSLVEVSHLQAALAVWDYCLASARLVFDTAPIDPTARRISEALDVNPHGLTRVQIRGLFHRHVSKERIDLALEQLMGLGLINHETSPGRGRSATLWARVEGPKAADAGA